MSAPDVFCPGCGCKNSYYQFWCKGCQESLSSPSDAESVVAAPPREADRKRLYQQVLDDLDRLVDSNQAPAAVSSEIRSFYRGQLHQIDIDEAKRAETETVLRQIQVARIAAQAGHCQQAIRSLQACAIEHPDVCPIDQILDELHERQEREQSAKVAKVVQRSLSESETLLARGQAKEAEELLSQAMGMDPNNQHLRDALANVRTDIETEASPIDASARTQSDDAEDGIVLAKLVDPDEGESADTVEPIHAELIQTESSSREDTSLLGGTRSTAQTPSPAPLPVGSPSPVESPPPVAQAALGATVPRGSSASNVAIESGRSFAEREEEVPHPTERLVEVASKWSTVFKPFLVDNVGWFVGTFLVIAGFVVLIVSFWGSIEQNRVLMHSLVYVSLAATTGIFFAVAYFMRLKYPQLESSSNVLLVIVALLIPLVFAAAALTTLLPGAPVEAIVQASRGNW